VEILPEMRISRAPLKVSLSVVTLDVASRSSSGQSLRDVRQLQQLIDP